MIKLQECWVFLSAPRWSEQWVAVCGYLLRGCGGGSFHQSCRQVPTSGTAWSKCFGAGGLWLHASGIQLDQAVKQTPGGCKELVPLYLPLWQWANSDFFLWYLLFSTSRFSWLCFSRPASFHWRAFVGFGVFFFSFVSRSVVSMQEQQFFTLFLFLICQLSDAVWTNNSLWFIVTVEDELKSKTTWMTGPTTASGEKEKRSRGVNADGCSLLCPSFSLMPFNSARIPDIHKPQIPPQGQTSATQRRAYAVFSLMFQREEQLL